MSGPAAKKHKAEAPAAPSTTIAADRALFETTADELIDLVAGELGPVFEMKTEAVEYVRRMYNYTTKGGKMTRGLTVLHARRTIAGAAGRELSAAESKGACQLGWCIEWLQACFLVADDVMDASVTRRGQPCWYKLPNVGTIAINDAFILRSGLFRVLRAHFREAPAYLPLLELFNETTYQTELGQLLDLTSQPIGAPPALERFTEDRYYSIVKYKTAFYSFYLPVACALLVEGVTEETIFAASREILVDMGVYFQVQDDWLDCYGSPEVIGKVGTDIQDNKCGWLIVQALKKCSPEQRAALQEHYGREEEASIAAVKAIYTALDLTAQYQAYEAAAYERLTTNIAAVKEVPPQVFNDLLAKIFKRKK